MGPIHESVTQYEETISILEERVRYYDRKMKRPAPGESKSDLLQKKANCQYLLSEKQRKLAGVRDYIRETQKRTA